MVARYLVGPVVERQGNAGAMPGPAGSGLSYDRVPFHMIANDGNLMEHVVSDGTNGTWRDFTTDRRALRHRGRLQPVPAGGQPVLRQPDGARQRSPGLVNLRSVLNGLLAVEVDVDGDGRLIVTRAATSASCPSCSCASRRCSSAWSTSRRPDALRARRPEVRRATARRPRSWCEPAIVCSVARWNRQGPWTVTTDEGPPRTRVA